MGDKTRLGRRDGSGLGDQPYLVKLQHDHRGNGAVKTFLFTVLITLFSTRYRDNTVKVTHLFFKIFDIEHQIQTVLFFGIVGLKSKSLFRKQSLQLTHGHLNTRFFTLCTDETVKNVDQLYKTLQAQTVLFFKQLKTLIDLGDHHIEVVCQLSDLPF